MSEAEKKIEGLKQGRSRERSKATKCLTKLKAAYQATDADADELAYQIHLSEKQLQALEQVGEELEQFGVQDDSNHITELEETIFKSKRLLKRLEPSESPQPRVEMHSKFKLDINLPKFSGDLLAWPEFWELYEASVHRNGSYSPVEKFVFLRGHLSGEAARAIQGLATTAATYQIAIDLLKDRFGRDAVRKETLMANLLRLPGVTDADDLKALQRLIDDLNANVRALEALGTPSDNYGELLLPVLKGKIPEAWRLQWARSKSGSSGSQGSEFSNFLKFLNSEMEIREEATQTPCHKPKLNRSEVSATSPAKSATSTLSSQRVPSQQRAKWTCRACGQGQHGLAKCDRYRRMNVEERWEVVKRARLCYKCLGPHLARDCQSKNCPLCNKHHHTSLHNAAQDTPSGRQTSRISPHAAAFTPASASASGSTLVSASAMPTGSNSNVSRQDSRDAQSTKHRYNVTAQGSNRFYQTALVEAAGPRGCRQVRVLLDGGSDTSYVRASLAEELGLPVTGTDTFACIGFQEKVEEPHPYNRVKITLRSRFDSNAVELEPYSTDRLCSALPVNIELPESLQLPNNMADDFRGGPVDILIGIDYLYSIVLWDQIEISERLRAIGTVFGFVLHGYRCNSVDGQPHRHSYHCHSVKSMWDLDTVGITEGSDISPIGRELPKPVWNQEEERYEMSLAWKSASRPVSNLEATRVRTARMESKLTEESTKMYEAQMKEMMTNSVIELAPTSDVTESATCVSHGGERVPLAKKSHEPLLTPSRSADADVEDESVLGMRQPPTESYSLPLNDDGVPLASKSSPPQEIGPPEAFYLPHRGLYRNGKLRIVFDGSAKDGTGKSLNDYLDPGDNLLLKLPAVVLNFRKDPIGCQTDIKAAFHQVSVREEDRKYLQFLWSGFRLRFARVPFGLSCSPYMLLKTIDTHLEGYTAIEPELCRKLRAGTYMDDICVSFRSKEEADEGIERTKTMFATANMQLHKSRLTGDSTAEAKVLGMLWRTEDDQLAVVVPKTPCPTTKRELLSSVSKTFDPLGVLTPWLIGGKVLFQQTWKETPAAQWDDPLPPRIQKEVETWWRGSQGEVVWFPRAFSSTKGDADEQIFHVFCDASKQAYCAVVYRVSGGESRIVMAKSRLAPLDPHLSVPRMELMAALIGARLMKFIRDTLEIQEPTVVFWTDSTDVLCWIWHNKPRKVFVENRVSAILTLTRPEQWRHVRGVDNPADLGTRGTAIPTMAASPRWWKGSRQILEGRCTDDQLKVELPELSPDAQKENRSQNCKKTVPASVTMVSVSSKARLFDITGCSSLKQAIERTAWVQRFVHNVGNRADKRSGALTSEERRNALTFWIREAQEQAYRAELACVRKGQLLPSASPLVKLRPQLNGDGILCAVPRTDELPLPILPELSHITILIIDEAHSRCFHQGTRVTLALLSAEYLIRRRSVHRVVSTCTKCRRYRGLSYQPVDGTLPNFRTEPSRPFSKVGVDFFGPLYVDKGTKVWVLLLTCATSRAVHLELVGSQNTEDVKRALRRFFALRGTPELVFSDNAKTFHALLPHLPRIVTWRFIPEAAPWWGGFWERMVGITKKCLKITLHQCHLSFDELTATLYELAFHLNLRPLTTSDDEPLTPAHLLFGVTSIRGVISPSNLHMDSVDRAWRHRRRVCDHLVRRWTKEYVAALRCWTVSPRGRPVRLPEIGDVVLVHGEGPRGRWPLARVESLIRGPDGHSRAAVILMRGKRTRRPINKLFQLEAVHN